MLVAVLTREAAQEMPRQLSSSHAQTAPKLAQSLNNDGAGPDLATEFWADVLKEFRNHLSIVLARSGELSSALPGASAATAQAADCLLDIEGSAARMEGMLTWMDAALAPGIQTIAEIGDVIERAVQMSVAALPAHVEVAVSSRPAAIKNRGAAVESALAALIIEVGHGESPSLPPAVATSATFAAPGGLVGPAPVRGGSSGSFHRGRTEAEPPASVHVSTASSRPGTVRISIAATQPIRLAPSGWRMWLARALLASVGAEVERSASQAGFEISFEAGIRSP
jgi:hypothetical protein